MTITTLRYLVNSDEPLREMLPELSAEAESVKSSGLNGVRRIRLFSKIRGDRFSSLDQQLTGRLRKVQLPLHCEGHVAQVFND
jgi:hypothetical protein